MNIDTMKAVPVLKTNVSNTYRLVQFGVDKQACLVSYTIEDPAGGYMHGISRTRDSGAVKQAVKKRLLRLNDGRTTTDAIERGRKRAVQLTKKRVNS